jgi:hypothetical protein
MTAPGVRARPGGLWNTVRERAQSCPPDCTGPGRAMTQRQRDSRGGVREGAPLPQAAPSALLSRAAGCLFDRRGVQHGPRACPCAAAGASCCVPGVAQAADACRRSCPLSRRTCLLSRSRLPRLRSRRRRALALPRAPCPGAAAQSCALCPWVGSAACAPCADAARALSTRAYAEPHLLTRAVALTPCACGECAGGTRGCRGCAMQGAPDAAAVGEPRAGAALRRARGRGASGCARGWRRNSC